MSTKSWESSICNSTTSDLRLQRSGCDCEISITPCRSSQSDNRFNADTWQGSALTEVVAAEVSGTQVARQRLWDVQQLRQLVICMRALECLQLMFVSRNVALMLQCLPAALQSMLKRVGANASHKRDTCF